jgi:pimeloyl-ACP methyl ester carboxylesterase
VKRLVTVVAAAAMIATGLSSVGQPVGAAPTGSAAGHIHWGACSDPSLASAGAQCGFLAVPLDYRHPGGAKIQIAVSRVKHTSSSSDYQGVILVNPGGPGGSGLGLATLGQYVPHGVGGEFDWIGFDPRGVGSSRPSISCIPNYFHGDRPDYLPTSQHLVHVWLARSRRYAAACGKHAWALLQHMKTTDAARDMDSIRRALGVQRISYYGFSYGTYLGQVYATMFPSHIRRMVFDSTVDPRNVWYRANLNQDVAFERTENIWFGWLARHHEFYRLGRTRAAVAHLFYREQAALAVHAAGGVVGSDEWNDAFLLAGYYQFFWTYLGGVFTGWVHHHNVKNLIQAYQIADGPGNDNGFAVYNAVQCSDVRWPQSWARWARDNSRVYKVAPFLTWANAWFNAPCLYWPAKPGTPTDVNGHHVNVLMIDETLDAATPYEGSLEVRSRFPDASLIAEPGGTTHAGTLFGNACVDNKIARFLATGSRPARRIGRRADTFCKPLPQPFPQTEIAARALSPSRRALTRWIALGRS